MASQTTIDLSHRNVSELDFSHHSNAPPPTTTATANRTVLFNDDDEDIGDQRQMIDENKKNQKQQLTAHERSLLARALILDASHNSITKLIGLSIFERLTVLDLSHNRLYIPNICVKKTSRSRRRADKSADDEYRPPSMSVSSKTQVKAVPSNMKQDGSAVGIASGLLVGGRLGGRKIVLDATPTRNAPGGTNSYILVGSRAAAPTVTTEPEDNTTFSEDDDEEDHSDNELWWISHLPKSIVSLNLSHNEIAVKIDTIQSTQKMGGEGSNERNHSVLLDGWVAATFLRHLTSLQILDLSHNFISTTETAMKSSPIDGSENGKEQLPLVWNPNTGYPHLPPSYRTPTPSTLELLSLAHNRGITTINTSLLAGLDALTELHLEGTAVRRFTGKSQLRHTSTTIDTDALSDCLPCLMTLHLKGTPLDTEVQATPAVHRRFVEELAKVGVRNLSLDIPSSSKGSSSPSLPTRQQKQDRQQQSSQSRPAPPVGTANDQATTTTTTAVSPLSRQQRDIVVKPATFVISPKEEESSSLSSSLSSSSSTLTSSSDYIDADDDEPAAVDFPSRDEDDLSESNESHSSSSVDEENYDTEAHDQQHVLELLLKGGHKQRQQDVDTSSSSALRPSRTSNYSDGYGNNYTTNNTGGATTTTEEEQLLAKADELEQQVLDVKARVFALRELSAEQEDFLRATRKNVCEDLKEMSELKVAVTTLSKVHQERVHLLSKRQRELKHAGVTSRRFQEKLLVQEQLNIERKMQRAEQRKRGLESLHEGRQMEQSGGLNISRFSSGSPINSNTTTDRRTSSSSPQSGRNSKSPQQQQRASSKSASSPIATTSVKASPRTRFVYDEFGNPTHPPTTSASPATATNEASAILHRMSPSSTSVVATGVSPSRGRRELVNHHDNYDGDDDDSSGSLSSHFHYKNASSRHRYNNRDEEVWAVDTTTEIDTSHMEDATSPRTPPEARSSITSANIHNHRHGPGGGHIHNGTTISGRNHLQVVDDAEEGSFSHGGGGGGDTSVCSTSQLDVSDGRAVSYAEVFNSMSSMQPDYPQPSARLDDPARRVRNDSARKSYRDASALQQQHERSMSCASNRSGSGGGGGGRAGSTTTATYEASGILKSFNNYVDPNNSATATATQRLSQSQREKAPYYRHAVQAHPFANSSQNTMAVKAPHGGSKPFSLRTVLVDADRFSKHSYGTVDEFPLTSAMLASKTIHQQRTDRASSSSASRGGGGQTTTTTTTTNPSHGLLKESRELLQMLSRNLYHSNSGPEAGTIAAVTSSSSLSSAAVAARGGMSRMMMAGGSPSTAADIRGQYGNASTHRPTLSTSPGSRVASSSVSQKNSRHVSGAYQAHGSVAAAERGALVLDQAVLARSAPRLQ